MFFKEALKSKGMLTLPSVKTLLAKYKKWSTNFNCTL